jgi:hypothetical protein
MKPAYIKPISNNAYNCINANGNGKIVGVVFFNLFPHYKIEYDMFDIRDESKHRAVFGFIPVSEVDSGMYEIVDYEF